jgi:cellulose synthase/poly-beta-1,6-N-acetylglucosamine synthase-like glycosyltransferase
MLIFISISLVTVSIFLAIAVAMLFVEVVAAMPHQNCLATLGRDSSQRIAVLVPAHNESIGLLPTLADIKAQLSPADQLLVVADNCTDDTAAVALAAGANVGCRNNPDRKGKGYALAWGLRHLHLNPPDVVIILDADCRLAEGAIARLAEACAVTQRPVQALDLMISPPEAPISYRFMELAWRVKNWVRPLGLKAIGLPCQLMGTGMAFPWDVICSADLASGSLVEDLKLGLDLTLARNPPLFCPSAIVTSEFPSTAEGLKSQRLRWEQGHIGMILTTTPRLIFRALKHANVNLLALALDAAVPPLSLLGMLVIGMVVIAGVATSLGVYSAALVISAASLIGFVCAILLSWLKFGRDIVPPGEFPSIVFYVLKKLPLYCRMLLRNSSPQWIRTDRRKVGSIPL